MSPLETSSAWGVGLVTVTEPGDRVLDTFFPDPRLGRDAAPAGDDHPLASAQGRDERRGVRSELRTVVIDDLARPPADAPDAYLRLHLLSHRLVRPREISLDGIFGVLPNVAFTTAGAVDPAELTSVLM